LDRTPLDYDKLPSKDNISYRIISGNFPVIGMPLREQVLLRRYLYKDRLDVFHSLCNTAPVGITMKNIITLHDTIQVSTNIGLQNFSDLWYWLVTVYSRWSIHATIHDSFRIITVSEYEKQKILDFFQISDNDKVVVTHLAPHAIFRPADPGEKAGLRKMIGKKFNIHSDYLLGIGYEKRKNIPLLVEAFRQLANEFINLNLVIVVADEDKRIYFQKLASRYNLDERVIVLGSVSATDLYVLYNLAKVFVFPSERESFGLPPLEAISCGTPTIAMNSTSTPEILEDGAMLIDGKDADKWAEAIRTVLVDNDVRSRMTERGLKRAAELSWEKCARKTIDMYEMALE